MQYREFEVQPGPHEAFDMPFPLFCLRTNSKALAELLSTAPRDRPHYGPPPLRSSTNFQLFTLEIRKLRGPGESCTEVVQNMF